VALDADRHGDPVAGVDDPGVLARPDEDVIAAGGQAPQVDPRGLVGAMLAPHHAEEGQLEVVRLAPQHAGDVVELVVGEPECAMQGFGAHDSKLSAVARDPGGRAAPRRASDQPFRRPAPAHAVIIG
jgi:hypothetical protein